MKKGSYIIWFLGLLVFTIMISFTKTTTESHNYDTKVQATNLTIQAFQTIYNHRIANNISLIDPTRQGELMDTYETGMIGYWLTDITTTSGSIRAKQLSTNPNFAAVVVDMLDKANVKENDEVGVVMSGSFPAIGIATLCALQIMNVKASVIVSIGASSYGATIPEFTIFDMIQVLYEASIIDKNINYVSFGGNDDTGNEFSTETRNSIINRIYESDINLLSGGSFEEVITNRMSIFQEEVPKMKLFINIGGHFSSLGQGLSTFLSDNGLIFQTKRLYSSDRGLINRYLEQGIPVTHFINIEDLVIEYDLSLNPTSPKIDLTSSVYYEEKVNGILVLIPVLLSFLILVKMLLKRKKPQKT
ncbi:MAG: poly-gamma-glutamate system protein [Bacilli bacterium]